MPSLRGSGGGLALLLLAVTLTACMRPPEPPPRPSRFGAAHRVRVLDAEGEVLGSFRVRRRSIAANDERGIRLGRAVALPNGIEVRDRHADLVWAIRPVSEGTAAGEAAPRARIEAGSGELLGTLELRAGEARLRDGEGTQIGEVRIVASEGTGAATTGEVYGAPGTDLLGRVVAESTRVVAIRDTDEDVVARLDGLELDPRAVGLLLLPAPTLESDAPAVVVERLYEAGVLLYVRVYGAD